MENPEPENKADLFDNKEFINKLQPIEDEGIIGQDLVHQTTGVNEVLIISMGLSTIFCVLFLITRSVIWLALLGFFVAIGLLSSKSKKKNREDEL